MSFLSPTFMFLFLPIAVTVLFLTPKAMKTDILPVAGIVFFVCVNISDPFALLYISFVSATIILAMAIYKKTQNKIWLYSAASVFFVIGAGILTLRMFYGSSLLRGAGVVMCLMSSVSLCLDVARGSVHTPETLWTGVTYATYFPTMLTGPFITFEDFTTRINNSLEFNFKNFSKGSLLFLKGFVKAIYIGAVLNDAFTGVLSFGHPGMGAAVSILIAVLQSLALYAFFSGYSDIARGVSLMVGIEIEPDMGDPFFNLSPAEYLKRFFKGFSIFFKRYIAAPIISSFGENLFSRIFSALLSAIVLLLLFCQNYETLLILLPFTAAAEYFVLFGRSYKKISSLPRRMIKYTVTFFLMCIAWAVVSSGSIAEIRYSLKSILSNEFFYLSHTAANKILNLKYLVLPLSGCMLSALTSFVISWDNKLNNKIGFTLLKYATATLLLFAFVLGIIMLLPQFPNLATHAFGANFI